MELFPHSFCLFRNPSLVLPSFPHQRTVSNNTTKFSRNNILPPTPPLPPFSVSSGVGVHRWNYTNRSVIQRADVFHLLLRFLMGKKNKRGWKNIKAFISSSPLKDLHFLKPLVSRSEGERETGCSVIGLGLVLHFYSTVHLDSRPGKQERVQSHVP